MTTSHPVPSDTIDGIERIGENDFSEPLGLLFRERELPAAFTNARGMRFEFSSRGDRVPGRLILPDGSDSRAPLILLQPGAGADKESEYLEMAVPWVRAGAAVATIDLPLHGERASAKFSERLLEIVRGMASQPGAPLPRRDHMLLLEFARQSVHDLSRSLDALEEFAPIDPERIGYAGLSLGGSLGAIFCSLDPRPRAVALAVAGGGAGPPAADPCRYIDGIAPRPFLLVTADRDEIVPKASSDALFAAASEPKRHECFDCGHADLPGAALKAMWSLLAEELGIGRAT